MARIIDVIENGESGGISIDAGVVRVRFSITYIVEGDDVTDDPLLIAQTPGLPLLNTTTLGGALCIDRRAEPINTTALLWRVVCDFDSKVDVSTAPGQDANDPTKPLEQREPRYNLTTETWEVDLVRDADQPDRLLVNPVGQPYQISTFYPIGVLTVTQFELPPFDTQKIWNYVGKVNSNEPYFGFPALTVLCSSINAQEEVHSDVTDSNNPLPKVYYKVIYTFKIRNNPSRLLAQIGWQEEVPIIGTQEIDPSDTSKVIKSVDANGNPIEVFLYNKDDPLAGQRKPVGDPPDWDLIYRYPQVDFSPLNLEP